MGPKMRIALLVIFLIFIIGIISLNIAASQVGIDCYEPTKEGDGKTNHEYLGFVKGMNIFGLLFVLIFTGIGAFIYKNVKFTEVTEVIGKLDRGITAYKYDAPKASDKENKEGNIPP